MSDKNNITENVVVTVAGKDRSAGLGRSIISEAESLDDPVLQKCLADSAVILELNREKQEDDFAKKYMEVFHPRTQLDLGKCKLPDSSNAGIAQRPIAAVRKIVWRLLRFVFEWVIFKQNVVNEQQVIALEHEIILRKRENEGLRKRIEKLELKNDINEKVCT